MLVPVAAKDVAAEDGAANEEPPGGVAEVWGGNDGGHVDCTRDGTLTIRVGHATDVSDADGVPSRR